MGVLVKSDKHKPGLWWVRVNHKGKRKSIAFHDRATAKRTAQEIERRLKLGDLGLGPAPGVPTFAAYADTWTAGAETRLRSATLDQVRSRLKRVLPTLGPLRLTKITRQTIRDLVGTIQTQGLAASQGQDDHAPNDPRHTQHCQRDTLASPRRRRDPEQPLSAAREATAQGGR